MNNLLDVMYHYFYFVSLLLDKGALVVLLEHNVMFDVWLTVHRSSVWNKKPTTSQWTHNQPTGSDCLHSHGYAT